MTYSVAITGALAENPQIPLNNTVSDTVARLGGQARACMTGEQFLVRGPDGGQYWATYDASRTVPNGAGIQRVLQRVGP
jgi:hypothetical protein